MLVKQLLDLRQTASPSVVGRRITYAVCRLVSCFHHLQKEFASLRPRLRSHSLAVKRKADDKSRSFSFFSFKMNAAIVFVYNHRACDGQPLSCPFSHFFSGKERIKNAGLNFLWNSGAAV